MFKKIALAVGVALTGGMYGGNEAQAHGGSGHPGDHNSHGRLHDDLDHNEFHRQLEHRAAHRYPMTGWQHDRLHDSLDHDRFHDHLRHRSYHRSYRPSYGYGWHGSYGVPHYSQRLYRAPHHYGYGGFGRTISPSGFSGFSLRIGR